MKKRVLSLILSLFLLVSCVANVTACNDTPESPHVHVWSTSWSSSSTEHWLTCDSCSEKKDVGNHDGEKCSICSYQNPNEAPPANTISKLYDFRVINTDYFTLVILPDGKLALIDPMINGDSSLLFLQDLLPYTRDADKDGLVEIDYLIVTSIYDISGDSTWLDFEVLNYYRPNIEIDLDKIKLWDLIPKYGFCYNGEYCSEEDFANIPESYLTGYPLSYYNNVKGSIGEQEGVYHGRFDYYLASLYYASKNNVNVYPLTSANNITNTFVYDGKTYSYTFNFLDIIPTAQPMTSYKNKIFNNKHENVEYYYAHDANDQFREYSHIFTITYQDVSILYTNLPTRNLLRAYSEKYGYDIKVDLFVSKYYNDDSMTNLISPVIFIKQQYGYDFPGQIFDINKKSTNAVFLNIYGTNNDTKSYGEYFYKENMGVRQEGAVMLKSNFIAQEKSKKLAHCFKADAQGQITCVSWDQYNEDRMWYNWSDWASDYK